MIGRGFLLLRLVRLLRLERTAPLRWVGRGSTLSRLLRLGGRRLLRLGRRRLLRFGRRWFLLLLALRRALRLRGTLLLGGRFLLLALRWLLWLRGGRLLLSLRRLLRLRGGGFLLLALGRPLRLRGTLRLRRLLGGRGLLCLRLLVLWGRPRGWGGTLLRRGPLRVATAGLLLLLLLFAFLSRLPAGLGQKNAQP